MQKVPHPELDMTFPKRYLLKFQEYRKRNSEPSLKHKRKRKPTGSPQVFSSTCKQSISLAGTKIYCCVLKELVECQMCKACPCHEPEPLEYKLFKRE